METHTQGCRARRAGLLAALLLAGVGVVTAPSGVARAASGDCTTSTEQTTCTFTYTGAAQTWTVPAGVSAATFDLYGAQGGGSGDAGAGGEGGHVHATLAVSPSTTYQLLVGGQGGGSSAGSGGYNGGGAGGSVCGGCAYYGGGGGGASDVRTGAFALADRLLVAGGGGGGGGGDEFGGGAGGYPNGGDGGGYYGGGGGTQSTGGSGGDYGDSSSDGQVGTLGQGGAGGLYSEGGDAGGGGGYYGGGGGGGYYDAGSGGGGGSSDGPAGATFESGVRSGDGLITITYSTSAATSTGLTCSPTPLQVGATTTCTATVTDTSAAPSAPSGTVTLTTSGSGAFAPASGACTLAPLFGDTATCTVSYATNVVGGGSDTLSASYGGDGTHSPSASPPYGLGISPAPLTITANNKNMTYGGTVPTLDTSYSGFINGDTSSVVSGLTCDATDGSGNPVSSATPAGSYAITCSGASAANYAISYMAGTLTIDPAPLKITASSPTVVYNGTVPAITPSYSGFVAGDSAASLSAAPTCTSTAPASGAAGAYQTSCTSAVDPNYSINYVGGTLTISPAAQTISFGSLPNHLLGNAPFTVSATGGGSGNPVTFSAGPSSVCTSGGTNGATITLVGVGICTVTASQVGSPNYQAAPSVAQSFTVSYPSLYLALGASSSPAGPITTGSTVTATLTLGNHSTASQTVTLSVTLAYKGSHGSLSMTVPLTLKLTAGQTLSQGVSFKVQSWFPRGANTLSVSAKDGSGDTAYSSATLTVS